MAKRRLWGRVGRAGAWFLPIFATGALAACGGGGSGAVRSTTASPPPTTPTTQQPPLDAQLSLTNTYAAHAAGYTGAGVVIGFVDSGIMRSNPAVAGRVLAEYIDVDPNANNTSIDDVVGHGTWTSSIAAGAPFAKFPGGIAPGAELVSARIISDNSPSDHGQPASVVSASDAQFFQAVTQQLIGAGVNVMNNSWGGITWDTGNASVNQAFDAAYSAFVNQSNGLVVFAAGNGSASNPSTIAALPSVAPDLQKGWLTVVAVNSNDPTQLASYSNQCGIAMNYCLAAPGDVIVLDKDTTAGTTNPKYYSVSGTSFAAPIVSGAAALVWQAFPYFSNAQVANTILETATPLGGSAPNPTFGWGMLNVGKAVQGPVSLDAFQGGVAFNGITSTWGNDIAGVGQTLTKSGTGTLVLTGNLGYSGGTVVNGGTLQSVQPLPLVRAQQGQTGINDVIVNSGGTLGPRTGTTGGVQNSGTVIVEGGDTNIGDYTQASTGTLSVSLGSILKTGQANLAGTLNVLGADTGYVSNNHQDVLEATSAVSGTFAKLTTSPGVFLSTSIQYTPTTVWLDTTSLNVTAAAKAMAITDAAALAAAMRVQQGFDAMDSRGIGGGGYAPDVLQGAGYIQHSPDAASAQATLQSLSGQLHAASAAMLFDGIDAGTDALSGHFDDLLDGRTRAGAWYAGLGRQSDLQRAGYAGVTFRSNGGVVGADFRVGAHALLGYAVGASRGYGQLDMAWDHSQTWMDHAMLYGAAFAGPWYASGQIGGGHFREDMQRLLLLGGFAAPVGSSFSGSYLAGSVESGFRIQVDSTHFVPFMDVRYQHLDQGAFAETGGFGFGLTANSRAAERLQAGVGLRVQRGWWLANGMLLQFDGSAAWRHALRQQGDVFDASFTSFDNWLPVDGVGLSRNESVLRAGMSWWPSHNFGLRLGLEREQGSRERAGNVLLQGALVF